MGGEGRETDETDLCQLIKGERLKRGKGEGMFYYDYELGKATDVLVNELLRLKEGETFVITADTESNPTVVDASARAAFAAGAKPLKQMATSFDSSRNDAAG